MKKSYALGIDFGTSECRALVLDLVAGKEIAVSSSKYAGGKNGVLLDPKNPHVARQRPSDYHAAMKRAVSTVVKAAAGKGVAAEEIKGIGVDATGSTPLPVDEKMVPLGMKKEFKSNLNAQAWLWKDHSSAEEAALITAKAKRLRPEYLAKCGGAYSSEWFWSKVLHCRNVDKNVFDAAYSWMEFSDYIPALLAGVEDPTEAKRNVCAAGHKGMYNESWGGLPDKRFLRALDPALADLRDRLYEKAYPSNEIAGGLDKKWAKAFGLPEGTPVGVGALDAHFGAIGSGVAEGALVKIMGTSTCDIMVVPKRKKLRDIPGVAGIVPDSVLPGYVGIEAGQSAVGDIFNWWVMVALGKDERLHKALTRKASVVKAGESGLLALDWNNGNRNVLTDPKLTGALVGQTLLTEDYEIYRALVEATAFGALRIVERIEEYGVKIRKVVNCGGIAEKNEMVMQIYADVMNRPMEVAKSAETVALGAAIMGGHAALKKEKGYEKPEKIQKRVCGVKKKVFTPRAAEARTYKKLYALYKRLHDAFGVEKSGADLYPVMKELLEIKREASA
jgi:L-ribulokinase